MSLLPKTKGDFLSKDYWEIFFKQRGNKAFEWYGEYSSYCALLAKYVKPKDVILEIGCGNSDLGAQMYDFGYKNMTCIDISSMAIEQMKQKHQNSRPDLKFLQMDLFNTTFPKEEFTVILDKGTLDAIYPEDTSENEAKVSKMFEEISKLLKFGGRYISFSLAQSFIKNKIIKYFSDLGWLVRVCLVPTNDEKDFYLPVFIFVLTKFKKMTNSKAILETTYLDDKVQRLNSLEEIYKSIDDIQNYALVKYNMKNKKLEEELCVHLYDSSPTPRYTIFVVEGERTCKKKFAIFIVPQGREVEWMFNTTEGRRELHKSCGYERLLVVLLNRSHHYADIDAVKAELSSKVLELSPSNAGKQSPFLTLGNSVSVRTVKEEGKTSKTGSYVVEDVSIDEHIYRRLVFLHLPDTVQSQALLITSLKRRGKKGSKVEVVEVDHSCINCQYYISIIAALAIMNDFLRKEGEIRVAMLGVGGGSLSMFLLKCLPNIRIDGVELDEKIIEIGRKWFGLGNDEMEKCGRLNIIINDAIKAVEVAKSENRQYNMVVVDIDNKDPKISFSSPSKEFLEESFLQCCHHILKPSGVLVINLVTRSYQHRNSAVETLKKLFGRVLSRKVADETNEVCYCIKYDLSTKMQELSVEDRKRDDTLFLETMAKNFEAIKNSINKHDKKFLAPFKEFDFNSIKFV